MPDPVILLVEQNTHMILGIRDRVCLHESDRIVMEDARPEMGIDERWMDLGKPHSRTWTSRLWD